MPVALEEILTEYAAAITAGSAEIMIGAGLSAGVGYPDWNSLLDPLRKSANVPNEVTDPPLIAEYIAHEIGRAKFDESLLHGFKTARSPGESHLLLAELGQLGLRSIWTTNYDTLIEDVFPTAYRVFNDNDYALMRRVVRDGRVTKIHGSLGLDKNGIQTWSDRPIITRSDYEGYQREHPIIWSDLKARFLTNTFLFLGFSFNDPNIEVLLRLSRTLDAKLIRSPHFALMRRETSQPSQRLQDLRVNDLEKSGVRVGYVDDFDKIPLFLKELRRRCIPPALFVSGPSQTWDEDSFLTIARTIQEVFPKLALVSMGSQPAYHLGRALISVRRKAEANDPELVKYFYRAWQEDRDVPHPATRGGTAVYTDLDQESLLRSLLDRTTAFLRISARFEHKEDEDTESRSWAELKQASERNIPSFILYTDHLEDITVEFNTRRGQMMITKHIDAFKIWLEDTLGRALP